MYAGPGTLDATTGLIKFYINAQVYEIIKKTCALNIDTYILA